MVRLQCDKHKSHGFPTWKAKQTSERWLKASVLPKVPPSSLVWHSRPFLQIHLFRVSLPKPSSSPHGSSFSFASHPTGKLFFSHGDPLTRPRAHFPFPVRVTLHLPVLAIQLPCSAQWMLTVLSGLNSNTASSEAFPSNLVTAIISLNRTFLVAYLSPLLDWIQESGNHLHSLSLTQRLACSKSLLNACWMSKWLSAIMEYTWGLGWILSSFLSKGMQAGACTP